MLRRGLVLAVLAAATIGGARASDPAPPDGDPFPVRFSEAEAVARAKAVSPGLARLRALESAAAASVKEAKAERYPTLDFSAGYTRNSNVPIVSIPLPGGGERTIFPNIPDNYRTRLEGAVPLYTGGRITALYDATTRLRDAAGKDVDAGANDLVFETRAGYWSLLNARESERFLRESLASYDAHLRDAENRRSLGLAAADEVLAVSADRDRAELGRLQAEKAALQGEENLRRLLDLSPGAPVELTDGFPAAAAPDVDTEALVAAALGSRPERSALEARRQALESQAKAEKSRRLPQLYAAGAYDYANPNRSSLPLEDIWTATWNVSVNLAFRIYDGGRASAAEAHAASEAEAVARQIDEFDRRVRLDVSFRVLDVRTAEAAIAVSQHQVEAAAENVRVTRDRYQEGIAPSSELLDAQTRLLRAELELTGSRTETQIARAGLDRAVGR